MLTTSKTRTQWFVLLIYFQYDMSSVSVCITAITLLQLHFLSKLVCHFCANPATFQASVISLGNGLLRNWRYCSAWTWMDDNVRRQISLASFCKSRYVWQKNDHLLKVSLQGKICHEASSISSFPSVHHEYFRRPHPGIPRLVRWQLLYLFSQLWPTPSLLSQPRPLWSHARFRLDFVQRPISRSSARVFLRFRRDEGTSVAPEKVSRHCGRHHFQEY